MRLHGRLWRCFAIGTLLLLTCLPATLAPDIPTISPARVLEQLEGASSELVPNLRPSHSFPSGNPAIPREGSSSTAFNSAVRQGKPVQLLPPGIQETSDGIAYRIEMQDTTLADDLVRELKSRAASIPVTDKKEKSRQRLNVAALRYRPARDLFGSADESAELLKLGIEKTVQAAALKGWNTAAPRTQRYRMGDIDFTIRNSHSFQGRKLYDYDVVATFGRDTEAPEYVYLGQLRIPKRLVRLSGKHQVPSGELVGAKRARSETASVEPSQRRKPSLGPVSTLENLQGGPSALTPDLHPSQSLFPSIPQEGSSSGAISRAVGRKRGREGEFRPPDLFRTRNEYRYRIEMQSDALVHGLMEEIKRRAEGMSIQPPQELIDDIRFKPARDLLEPSGQPGDQLEKQISSVITSSSWKDYEGQAPIVYRYYAGQVDYTMKRSKKHVDPDLYVFNVVATVGRGTKGMDRIYLGRLELPAKLITWSNQQEQAEALAAAQRAAVEPVRVHPANLVPGGVGQALQHNEAGRGAEHLRPLVRHNERPRLDPEERPPFDLNELPHEYESGEDA